MCRSVPKSRKKAKVVELESYFRPGKGSFLRDSESEAGPGGFGTGLSKKSVGESLVSKIWRESPDHDSNSS